ncbi:NifU family protein [Helicobacter cappadocius]|uniref:NifU family protein n=1 Tax=Helicobacter cappadocius TaxID=3063998 RepID=A0AA90Q030_9HELI|nr:MULTISPECIES: NifU family protein [unclassified Helicobacter]MDO7253745.1 NifU family protein [Helicobacter sp. faydin-H75]MDP2539673.1 NifU family protein [Helicobacter sp. faydin-H76]
MFPFSDKELQKPVEKSIEKIRPLLTNDGGDISILAIKDAKVYVRLEGACKTCPSSTQTLKNGIERQLKEDIHPDIEIINIRYGEEKNYPIF